MAFNGEIIVNDEALDIWAIDTFNVENLINESSATLLDGGWSIQTLGYPAQQITMRVLCNWNTLQEIKGYAITKDYLIIHHDPTGMSYSTKITSQPTWEKEYHHDNEHSMYRISLTLAVITNV